MPLKNAWLIAGWLALSGVGSTLLWAHASRPGAQGLAAPRLSEAPRTQDTWTLFVLVHPRCPCSRATLAELARLTARTGRRMQARVLFWKPEAAPEDWTGGGLWEQARAIPGVRVEADTAGREARRLGAVTSGQVVLYAPDGQLAFQGGITPARGHEGDSAGRDRVLSLVTGGAAAAGSTPVFGCPMRTGPERTDTSDSTP